MEKEALHSHERIAGVKRTSERANGRALQRQMKNWKRKKRSTFTESTYTHVWHGMAWQRLASKVSKQETGGKQFTRIYLMALILFQAAKAPDEWNKRQVTQRRKKRTHRHTQERAKNKNEIKNGKRPCMTYVSNWKCDSNTLWMIWKMFNNTKEAIKWYTNWCRH